MANILVVLSNLQQNLLALGARPLISLGIAAILVFTIVMVAGYQLSKPPMHVLNSGMAKQESGKVTSALREANLKFDVSPDGATVYIEYGKAASARMFLARKGLSNSPTAGYELFDKIGSFGLTSFMQEVTKLRAIEGELSRTRQHSSAILYSPRKPSSTMRIFSSDERYFLVARRMFFTTRSGTVSGVPDFRLISTP